MAGAPHPQSVITTPDGRQVDLKIHQCVWSGEYVPNSLPAVLDCYRAHVARAEIDIAMLRDEDFLVVHDLDLAEATDGHGQVDTTRRLDATRLRLLRAGQPTSEHAPLLTEVVAAIAEEPYSTLLELDLKDWKPWPWRRVEELARIVAPVRDRVTFGGNSDTNLRRLGVVDPALHLGYTLPAYSEWRRPVAGDDPASGGREGAAQGENAAQREELVARFDALLAMVPRARELHVHLEDGVALASDGLADLAARLRARGILLDAWTITAGTPAWQARLAAALRVEADIITTETPRELVREASAAFARNRDDV